MKKILTLVAACLLPLTAFAQEAKKTDIYADNIVVVFDASGSMGESIRSDQGSIKKIVAGKSALKQVLQKLDADNKNVNVGLFVFGRGSNSNPYPIAPLDLNKMFVAIDNISDGGGTPLGEYMKKAADQILVQRAANFGYGRYKIMVVTDGEATDSTLMAQVAPAILKRAITLDVIGVGMDKTHTLAKMSSSYRAANDTKALNAALTAIVAETSKQNVKAVEGVEDDFKLISHLSDEQAKTIITNLHSTENQPLLEKQKAEVHTSIVTPNTVGSVAANNPSSGINPLLIIGIIIGAIFIIFIFIAALGS